MQNDVNKTALNSVAQAGGQVHHHHAAPGTVPTQRQCPNGHAAGPNDRFCAICGAALQA